MKVSLHEQVFQCLINPLLNTPISGSSFSAANKNIMSRLWMYGVQLSD